MLKRIHRLGVIAACGLALGLLTAPSADAASLTAKVVGEPWVLVWVDQDGYVKRDPEALKAIQEQFSGSDWSIEDGRRLVMITKNRKLLGMAFYAPWDNQSYFPLHWYLGSVMANGFIVRSQDDPSKGWATLFIITFDDEGRTVRTAHLEVALSFSNG
jgi:hypothetical protein